MNELIQKIHAEVLADHKQRHPGISEGMIEDGARRMADLIVSNVQQAFVNPPVSMVKPPQARQFPAGLSPERIARLRQISEDGARYTVESDAEVTAIRRSNIEGRVKQFFDGTGIQSATMTAFIEAAKREAGW